MCYQLWKIRKTNQTIVGKVKAFLQNILQTRLDQEMSHSLNRLETLSSLPSCAPMGFPALSSHPSPASRRPSPATAFRRPVPPRTQNGMDLALRNVHPFHLFADASKDYIHIKSQQRNIRKTLTTLQEIKGWWFTIKKKLVKPLKKKFASNGTVIEHPEDGEVIPLQGDQSKNICQFLLEIGRVKDSQLKVHGFKGFWLTET